MKKNLLILIIMLCLLDTPTLTRAKPDQARLKPVALNNLKDEIPLPSPTSPSAEPTSLPAASSSAEPTIAPTLTPVVTPAPIPTPEATPQPVPTPIVSPTPQDNSDQTSQGVVLGTQAPPPPGNPPTQILSKIAPLLQSIFQSKPKTEHKNTITPPLLSELATSPENFYLSQGLNKEEDAILLFTGTALLIAGLILTRPTFSKLFRARFQRVNDFLSVIIGKQSFDS